MIEIKPVDYYDDDTSTYDMCNEETIASLQINNIKIPLCDKCVKELTQSLEEFHKTVFCHKCQEFVMSESGWKYGGSCKRKARINNEVITEKDAGYNYCVDCMDTCKDAVLKEKK